MAKTSIHSVYKLQDGSKVPSVTTVLNVLNKPALLQWAWQCGVDGLDYRKVRDTAGNIGTLVHYLILCDLKGEKPDTSEYSPQDVDKAESCLIRWWDWRKAHTLFPVLVETPLVSEIYRFGGTPDFVGEIDGELTVLDLKTGKALYPEHIYQLAAYWKLLQEHKEGYFAPGRILRIGREETEGFEDKMVWRLETAWEVFAHCLAIYKLQKEAKE